MTTPNARILAIHDDPETLLMVGQVLAGSFECEFASDDASAREKLAAGGFDPRFQSREASAGLAAVYKRVCALFDARRRASL